MSMLHLKIIGSHSKSEEIECDSIHFQIPDDSRGCGGGSMGIRPGHENSLIALAPGAVDAFLKGEKIFSAEISGGFMTDKDDIVTVVESGNLKY